MNSLLLLVNLLGLAIMVTLFHTEGEVVGWPTEKKMEKERRR